MAKKVSFSRALNAFDGFQGCQIPKDPTNQTEFEALKEAVTGKGVWSGTPPTYAQVAAKLAELQAAEDAKLETKKSAYEKLGLTEAEIAAIL